jgi:hypothetical protein
VIVALPGDGKADQKWKVIRLAMPFFDTADLLRVAESQYFMRNRTELECHIKTRNLTSFGGESLDTDILDMRPGDAAKLVIDHAAYGSVSAVSGLLDAHGQNEAYLRQLGFQQDFIIAYAAARTAAQFPKKFVLKEMKVDWDSSTGVDLDMTFINFIVARLDKDPPGDTPKR